jgi:hypothetical protein
MTCVTSAATAQKGLSCWHTDCAAAAAAAGEAAEVQAGLGGDPRPAAAEVAAAEAAAEVAAAWLLAVLLLELPELLLQPAAWQLSLLAPPADKQHTKLAAVALLADWSAHCQVSGVLGAPRGPSTAEAMHIKCGGTSQQRYILYCKHAVPVTGTVQWTLPAQAVHIWCLSSDTAATDDLDNALVTAVQQQ